MSWIQEQIMKAVARWAAKFDSCLPAGDDRIIFKSGERRISVKFIPEISFYQVMVIGNTGPIRNDIGVREDGLASYFTAKEIAAGLAA